jgi:hypothetical protein
LQRLLGFSDSNGFFLHALGGGGGLPGQRACSVPRDLACGGGGGGAAFPLADGGAGPPQLPALSGLAAAVQPVLA